MKPVVVFALLAAFNPGCSCSGNGHVVQAPFVAALGDTAVNCNCNLTFDYPHCTGGTCRSHFDIRLCLPPNLNVEIADPSTDAGIALANLSDEKFKHAVDDYCRNTVSRIVYHMIKVFNGGWCDYKARWAPDGGIGNSVECFAQPIGPEQPSATQREESVCVNPCDNTICDYDTNCGEGVQDEWGNIHIDRCQCNQITRYGCPGDPPESLPTPVFCRPPR